MDSNSNNFLTVSIITVCFNSAKTIEKTIRSVLAQKNLSIEYIIIDGGSIDGTQDIVKSYSEIDRFISEPDQGIADAFNKGIALATGDIIGLINSDDILLPETIDTVRKFFLHNEHTEVLHGDLLLYDKENFIKRLKPAGKWWYPWRLVLFNHPATFVRKRVYERCGRFDISYRYAMDDELYLRWMHNGFNIHYLPELLVQMQAGGASGINTTQVFIEKRRALLKHGYSRILVELQFVCRFIVQVIVILKSIYRNW